MTIEEQLSAARARLLHDLEATVATTPAHVDVLEDVVAARREWVQPWPEGASYLTCLMAQDLQEQLQELVVLHIGRWPQCRLDGAHQLHVEPDLGADPHWVCEDCATIVAPIGGL